MAKLKKTSKEQSSRSSSIQDPRFAGIQSDPRFHIPKRKHLKDNLDERFKKAIETDEAFQDEVAVDRYGRKVTNSSKKEFEKYYNMDEDEDAREVNRESGSESEGDNVAGPALAIDRARGEGSASESESESSSDDSSDELEAELESEEELNIDESSDIPLGDATSRFAAVSMDWDRIRAVDLMVAFSSFVPKQGRIKTIQIFPSEYGKQRLAQEDLEGPARDDFEDKRKKSKRKTAEDFSEEDSDEEEERIKKSLIQEDLGEEVDSSKFRKYQLQRLQYYYAVVSCDRVSTAKAIYDSCDGTEYESTANFFDLRYIPEDMSFEDRPHDECTEIPFNFKPSNFVTDALQHSKVKLTWDETPMERKQMATRAFSQKEIDDMDFKAYLASDSESEEDDTRKQTYRELLGDIIPKGKSSKDEDIDMEITFTPGLDEKEESDSEEEDEEETTIAKYKRKEKERRKRRMEKFKESKRDIGEEDETVKKSNQKRNHKSEDGKKSKKDSELELLLMDDDLSKLSANGKQSGIVDSDEEVSKRKSKSKKSKKLQRLEESESQFDIKDARFQDLFDNPDFAIDPTAPQFKKTMAMEKVMEERRKRTISKSKPVEKSYSKKRKVTDSSNDALNSLVHKIKRRAKH
jgi:NUC153 domain